MLLYIMLLARIMLIYIYICFHKMQYTMLVFLMLFACLMLIFFANTNAFCFHALSWVIDTEFVYLKYYFVLCKILLIGWFS